MSSKERDIELLEEQMEQEMEELLRLRTEKFNLLQSKHKRLSSEAPKKPNADQKSSGGLPLLNKDKKLPVSSAVLHIMSGEPKGKHTKDEIVSAVRGIIETESKDLQSLIAATLQRLKNAGSINTSRSGGKVYYSITSKGLDKLSSSE